MPPILTTGAGVFPVISGGGGGTFSFLAGSTNVPFGANGGNSNAINTTGAGLLILGVSYYTGGSGLTISDSKSNTWNSLTATTGGGNAKCIIYYSVPTSVGTGHTASLTGTSIYTAQTFAAFSGGAASPADQQSENNGASGTSATSTSITPSVGSELVITFVGNDADTIGASSVSGGFTIVDVTQMASSGNNMGGGMAYLIQTAAVAANPTWTLGGSSGWTVKMGSFKVS
jgi:hypothetical protein